MSSLWTTGRAVDVVLFVIAIEWVLLVALARWRPIDAALRLAPGVLLLLALRQALTGADWRWVAIPVALSFPFHIADLVRSSRGPAKPPH